MARNLVVLGAGASRAVSYANEGHIPSPLDRDFRDLLTRLTFSGKSDLGDDRRPPAFSSGWL